MIQDILQQTMWIEWIGFILALFQVILSRQNNPINYIFGIASVIITLIIMYDAELYAEFTLNIYYLLMSIYGLSYWKFGKSKEVTPITYSNYSDKLKTLGIIIFSFGILYFVLTTFTNSDVPIWDASISAFAWSGMWLMARRKIENWILLNISNLISIPLMIHKSLYLYAILSIILFCIAISGYFNWKRILKENSSSN